MPDIWRHAVALRFAKTAQERRPAADADGEAERNLSGRAMPGGDELGLIELTTGGKRLVAARPTFSWRARVLPGRRSGRRQRHGLFAPVEVGEGDEEQSHDDEVHPA